MNGEVILQTSDSSLSRELHADTIKPETVIRLSLCLQ